MADLGHVGDLEDEVVESVKYVILPNLHTARVCLVLQNKSKFT